MTPDTNSGQAASAQLQNDVADLKAIVKLLAKLVEDGNVKQAVPATTTAAVPANVTTADTVEARDTVFRYRLLTALTSASSLRRVVATITRDRDDLLIARGTGQDSGTSLSFMADGQPFELPVTNDRVSATELKKAGVDLTGHLESFVLRSSPGGHIIAVASTLTSRNTPATYVAP